MGTTLASSANDSAAGTRRGRPNYTPAFKRQVIAEATVPGVSVAAVAQRHQLHPNMLFRWIRELRATGALPAPLQLLEVVAEPPAAAPAPMPASAPVANPGPVASIEVVFPAATVRVQGDVSQSTLRTIFLALARLS